MNRRRELSAKMYVCSYSVRNLLTQIEILEANKKLSIDEKMLQLKKIKEEITKVGMEIDNIKKEIILLNTSSVN